MIRFLAYNARSIACEANKRTTHLSQSSPAACFSTSRTHVIDRRRDGVLSLHELFSQICCIFRRSSQRFKYCLYQNRQSRCFYGLASSNSSMSRHSQLAWERLRHICTYSGPKFPPLSRGACIVCFSFTRCQLVPGILAFSLGELAWARRVLADGRYFSNGEAVMLKALDTQVLMSYAISSLIEGIYLIFRAIWLAILFFPAIAMAPFANSFGVEFRRKWLITVHHSLERAGPAFIKWGQWAATRPDLFPNDLCVELAKLHSTAPAHSFAYSKLAIERAFGRGLSDIFESFEEIPVASGSIAQVHRASLRYQYPGKQYGKSIDVAVKVRHPNVGESIKRDFILVNFIAKISNFIPGLRWLRLDESVRQFAVFMMSQVDLSREAAHLSRFLYNFRRWKHVSFPKPVYPYVHPSVLVETFEQGESVTRVIDDIEGNLWVRKDLAHIGTYAFLKMLLEDNFIHADMHPGNILVRVPSNSKYQRKFFRTRPHIVFLDVGMIAELSHSDLTNLHQFFKAVALRDGRTAAECTLKLSRHQSCPNPKAFIKELEKTFSFWGSPEGDIFHPVECMHQLLEQVRRHRVNIDGNVCTVLVTILVLEGWQRKLDPGYDIMQTLKALLLEKEILQPKDILFG